PDGLAFLHANVLSGDGADPNADLEHVARTVATVAWSDLASAFSLWSHRMVLEYLAQGERAALARWGDALLGTRTLGSTALAGPIAHHLGQSRLALEGTRDRGSLLVGGKIRWASNLFTPDFVLVSAAVVNGALVTFVAHGGAPGLRVDPYPSLVALQATGSSSVRLESARIAPEATLSDA